MKSSSQGEERMTLRRRFCEAAWLGAGCAALALSGCKVGPNYVKPAAVAPPVYKNAEQATSATPGVDWTKAMPNDAANRGEWWVLFDDEKLNELESKAAAANQSIMAAEAAFRQARALVRQARSGFYPTVGSTASAKTQRLPLSQLDIPGLSGDTINQFQLAGEVSWEPDLWGKVRRQVESDVASAQASAADIANTRLAVQAEIASDYFLACGLDEEDRLFAETIAYDERTLELTREKLEHGAASQIDVKQVEAQLEAAKTQARDLGVQRAQYEDALALLIGVPAPNFTLPHCQSAAKLPQVPPGAPSELLERRPDVASTERKMAEANAQIGLAKAAYYPSLPLTASGGVASRHLSDLIDWPSRVWSLGGSATEMLFDGGSRKAQVSQAQAGYEAATANYRQTVLTAFKEVQDNLSASAVLASEAATQSNAVSASQRTVELMKDRLSYGTASSLELMSAQNTLLANQQTVVSIRTRQMTTAVQLIKALGGGWQDGKLPTSKQLH